VSKAFVLVNCDLGTDDATAKELVGIGGVSSVYRTHGVYDLVIRLESDSFDGLKKSIQQIRRVNHVRSSLTVIVIEDKK
jgi:DNA-binding Lrp family transcriptional regulator